MARRTFDPVEAESPVLFARAIDRVVEAVPRAGRETIEAAGHVPQMSVPERYVETILSFLREVEASTAEPI